MQGVPAAFTVECAATHHVNAVTESGGCGKRRMRSGLGRPDRGDAVQARSAYKTGSLSNAGGKVLRLGSDRKCCERVSCRFTNAVGACLQSACERVQARLAHLSIMSHVIHGRLSHVLPSVRAIGDPDANCALDTVLATKPPQRSLLRGSQQIMCSWFTTMQRWAQSVALRSAALSCTAPNPVLAHAIISSVRHRPPESLGDDKGRAFLEYTFETFRLYVEAHPKCASRRSEELSSHLLPSAACTAAAAAGRCAFSSGTLSHIASQDFAES
jgi:hypothetical protein